MKKVRMYVNGRVQGVGFRFTTKMVADELGIRGIARNEDDGSVTIEAIGTDSAMANFILKVKASPSPMGKVTHFEAVEVPDLPDYPNFSTK